MKLRDDVSMTTTDYGAVLLDERAGVYWQLNDTGAIIVTALLEGTEPASIARWLSIDFDVAPGQAEADVVQIAQQLVDAGIAEP